MQIGSVWLPSFKTIQEFSAVFRFWPYHARAGLDQGPNGTATFSQGVGKQPTRYSGIGIGATTYTWKADEGQVLGWSWNEANKWVEWLRIWEEDEVVAVEDVKNW
jgi:hypothetical protein